MTHPLAILAVLVLAMGTITDVTAQEPPATERPAESAAPPAARVPADGLGTDVRSLSVQVVLSRHQGDTRISSLPYALAVTTDGTPSQLRMGGEIPIATAAMKGAPTSVQYRPVGTNIDCHARALDGDRYRVTITIEDSSVYPGTADAAGEWLAEHPSFRSYRSSQTVVLRDGQTLQYTMATDKITGEVIRAEVSLSLPR
jgi:Flp pilus assembly secretin CpaC